MTVTHKSLASPDDTKAFDLGQAQVVRVGEHSIRRFTFEPGWRWTTSIGPTAKTDSCQAHHIGYILSGTLHVKTNDGDEAEFGAGEAYDIQPGHDGWVVGDEPFRGLEFQPETASGYGR